MTTERWYLAGPMSGIPQFNVPFFDEVIAFLRANAKPGVEFISPAELDSPAMRAFSLASPDGKMPSEGKIAGETWGDCLARDVRLIADGIDGLVLLPGWERSRGARLEAFVGLLCNKKFAFLKCWGRFSPGNPYYLLRPVFDTEKMSATVVRGILQGCMP